MSTDFAPLISVMVDQRVVTTAQTASFSFDFSVLMVGLLAKGLDYP